MKVSIVAESVLFFLGYWTHLVNIRSAQIYWWMSELCKALKTIPVSLSQKYSLPVLSFTVLVSVWPNLKRHQSRIVLNLPPVPHSAGGLLCCFRKHRSHSDRLVNVWLCILVYQMQFHTCILPFCFWVNSLLTLLSSDRNRLHLFIYQFISVFSISLSALHDWVESYCLVGMRKSSGAVKVCGRQTKLTINRSCRRWKKKVNNNLQQRENIDLIYSLCCKLMYSNHNRKEIGGIDNASTLFVWNQWIGLLLYVRIWDAIENEN